MRETAHVVAEGRHGKEPLQAHVQRQFVQLPDQWKGTASRNLSKKKKARSLDEVTRSTTHDRMSNSDKSILLPCSDTSTRTSTRTRSPSMQTKKTRVIADSALS
jgi:hypothetical protein